MLPLWTYSSSSWTTLFIRARLLKGLFRGSLVHGCCRVDACFFPHRWGSVFPGFSLLGAASSSWPTRSWAGRRFPPSTALSHSHSFMMPCLSTGFAPLCGAFLFILGFWRCPLGDGVVLFFYTASFWSVHH